MEIKKNRCIGIAIFIFLLFISNIVLSCVFPTDAPNVFTTISGWVSGISTIILGIIAFGQNKRYKKDNDDALQKQYDFEIAKIIIDGSFERFALAIALVQ